MDHSHPCVPAPSREMRKTARKSRGHFCGQLVVRDRDGRWRILRVESLLEAKIATVLAMRPDVVELEEQVLVEWIDEAGRARRHYFDFRVLLRDGRRIAVAVKPAMRARSARFSAMIEAVARQTPASVADMVVVMTDEDIDPVELHNAQLLMGVRERDEEADAVVERVVAPMIGARPLSTLTAETGLGVRGRRALLRLLRAGRLALAEHRRIADDARLCLGETAPC